MKKTIFLKNIAMFCACLFTAMPMLLAFHVPSSAGKVRDSVRGTNGKTVYLIEEAHADYGAQKALAAILNYLIRNEKNKLVLVEGGWGNVGLSYLRTYGSEKGRLEIAEQYLKEGKISGEEYLDVTSDLPMQLIGVEKETYYAENMKAFLAFEEQQQALQPLLEGFKKVISVLQEQTFSPEVQTLLKQRAAFAAQNISIIDYLHLLKSNVSPEVFASFPTLKKFEELSSDESGYDAGKAQLEKRELISKLSRLLTKPELETLQVLETKKNLEGELETLRILIRSYEKFPELQKQASVENLKGYGRMIKRSLKLDSAKMFSELPVLEEKVFQDKIQDPSAKEFFQLMLNFENLEKLFALQLTPKDYEKLFSGSAVDVLGWAGILKAKLSQRNITDLTVPDAALLQKTLPMAQAFYQSARKREDAMFENAVSEMDRAGQTQAAMIIGGFHSKNIFEKFSKAGYTVFYVSPHFEVADGEKQHRQYLQILKSKWQHFELVQNAANQNDQILPLQSVKK